MNTGQFYRADAHLKHALVAALPHSSAYGLALRMLARLRLLQGHVPEAVQMATEAQAIIASEEAGSANDASVLHLLGQIKMAQGELAAAHTFLEQSKCIRESIDDSGWSILPVLSDLAELAELSSQDAAVYLDRICDTLDRLEAHPEIRAEAFARRARALTDLQLSRSCLHKAAEMLHTAKPSRRTVEAYLIVVEAHDVLGFSEGEALFQNALSLARSVDRQGAFGGLLCELRANRLFENGNFAAALTLYNKALQAKALTTTNFAELVVLMERTAQTAQASGNFTLSTDLRRQAADITRQQHRSEVCKDPQCSACVFSEFQCLALKHE